MTTRMVHNNAAMFLMGGLNSSFTLWGAVHDVPIEEIESTWDMEAANREYVNEIERLMQKYVPSWFILGNSIYAQCDSTGEIYNAIDDADDALCYLREEIYMIDTNAILEKFDKTV